VVTTDPDGGGATTEQVTVALTTPGSATLSGTKTVAIDWGAGQATFGDLSVDVADTYTLTATETGFTVTDATSASFTIAAAAPSSVSNPEGDGQTGLVGYDLNEPPTVLVQDASSNPVQGATVDFVVTGGGGSLSSSSAVTDADGKASVDWTLGSGTGANTLSATVNGTAITTNFTATGITSQYGIDVRFISAVDSTTGAAFDSAAARWARLVIGDVSDVPIIRAADHCFGEGEPAISETIDDVLIWASVVPIDGVGGVLGSAGFCYYRTADSIPLIGQMRFDSADLPWLIAGGQFEDVVLHEMGHVLGLGRTLWSWLGYLQNPSLPSSPGVDTHFDGARAIAAFDALGGTSYTGGAKVPVENAQGGSGTQDSHWRETVLGSELMTGFLNGGAANPLSRLSVAALWDLGYLVNLAGADTYAQAFAAPPPGAGNPIHLQNDEYVGPVYGVDPSGTVVGRGGPPRE
jgi:hypothetical protein